MSLKLIANKPARIIAAVFLAVIRDNPFLSYYHKRTKLELF